MSSSMSSIMLIMALASKPMSLFELLVNDIKYYMLSYLDLKSTSRFKINIYMSLTCYKISSTLSSSSSSSLWKYKHKDGITHHTKPKQQCRDYNLE